MSQMTGDLDVEKKQNEVKKNGVIQVVLHLDGFA